MNDRKHLPKTGWSCPNCGSVDPHSEIDLLEDAPYNTPTGEYFTADVTCQSVYIDSSAFDGMLVLEHEQMEQLIQHYEETIEEYEERGDL